MLSQACEALYLIRKSHIIHIIPITSYTQNRKLDPRYLIPIHALLRVPITELNTLDFSLPLFKKILNLITYTRIFLKWPLLINREFNRELNELIGI